MKHHVFCIFYVLDVFYEFVVVAYHLVMLLEYERLLWIKMVLSQMDVICPQIIFLFISSCIALANF